MAKPEKRFRCGGCEAAVFANEINKGGSTVKLKKFAFQKRYKTPDGDWRSTSSLDINDIPKAVLALSKAYEYLVLGDDSEAGGELIKGSRFE